MGTHPGLTWETREAGSLDRGAQISPGRPVGERQTRHRPAGPNLSQHALPSDPVRSSAVPGWLQIGHGVPHGRSSRVLPTGPSPVASRSVPILVHIRVAHPDAKGMTELLSPVRIEAMTLGEAWLAIAKAILIGGAAGSWEGLPIVEVFRATLDVRSP